MGAYTDKNAARTADVISLYKMGSPAIDSITSKEVKALKVQTYAVQKNSFKAVLGLQLLAFKGDQAATDQKLVVKVKVNGVFKDLKEYDTLDYFEDLITYVKAEDKITYDFEYSTSNTGTGQLIKDFVDVDARVLLIVADPPKTCN